MNVQNMKLETKAKYLERAVEETNQKWCLELKDRYMKLASNIVEKFYDDLSPRKMYDPKWNLHNTYDVKISEDNTEIDYYLDSVKMKEHYKRGMTAQKIYELTMIKGYHGGAKYGEGHPNEGIPYWRTPSPMFPNWYDDPAAKARFSPDEEIIKLKKKEIDSNSEDLWWSIFYDVITRMGFIRKEGK